MVSTKWKIGECSIISIYIYVCVNLNISHSKIGGEILRKMAEVIYIIRAFKKKEKKNNDRIEKCINFQDLKLLLHWESTKELRKYLKGERGERKR